MNHSSPNARTLILSERDYTRKRWGDEADNLNQPCDWYAFAIKDLTYQRNAEGGEVFLERGRSYDLPLMLALQRTAVVLLSDLEAEERLRGPMRPDAVRATSESLLDEADAFDKHGNRSAWKMESKSPNTIIFQLGHDITEAYHHPNPVRQWDLKLGVIKSIMWMIDRAEPELRTQVAVVTAGRMKSAAAIAAGARFDAT